MGDLNSQVVEATYQLLEAAGSDATVRQKAIAGFLEGGNFPDVGQIELLKKLAGVWLCEFQELGVAVDRLVPQAARNS